MREESAALQLLTEDADWHWPEKFVQQIALCQCQSPSPQID